VVGATKAGRLGGGAGAFGPGVNAAPALSSGRFNKRDRLGSNACAG
jgi:hypothetical protein